MSHAIVLGGVVIAVVEEAPIVVSCPSDGTVLTGWTYADGAFRSPAPAAPWQIKVLDGQYPVEAVEVVDKCALPPGLNIQSVDGVRVSVETANGFEEVQNGDFLCRLRPDASDEVKTATGMQPGKGLRLAYDQGARRLA